MSIKEWKVTRLGDFADVRLGRQRSPKRATGPNMRPYLRAANVRWTGFDLSDVKEMDFTGAEFETYRLRDGDMLLAEASGSASEVGKCAVWRSQLDDVCFQNTLIRVRAPLDLVPFLAYHFLKDARTGAFASASRGVGIHHLGAKTLTDWEVTLPPLPEQRRIVAALDSYLSRLDAAVAALERVAANLKRYRASVLQAAVTGRLVPTEAELAREESRDYEPASVLLDRILDERRRRWEEAELAKLEAKGKPPKNDTWKAKYKEPAPPDTSELPELPEGWCWATVEQLTSRITSGSRDWRKYYDKGTGVFLMAQNVRPGRLDLTHKQYVDPPLDDPSCERSQVLEDDLLVTIVGANTGDVCRIPQPLAHTYVCQSVALLRPVAASTAKMLDLYLNSPPGQGVFEGFMYGQGRPHLGFDDLRATPVPVPPLAEQARIIEHWESHETRCNTLLLAVPKQVQRAKALRQSILRWAFEGKLVDQDPDDEPASVLLECIRAEREAAAPKPKAKRKRRTRRKEPAE